ncbi:MAG: hypothetical protein GXY39_00205 [Actinomycetales bacterium]|nr:hypothetical protein [Tetrasphaera sp.]NLW98105.1 hypothetical protein [Actinomycetales bacterium]
MGVWDWLTGRDRQEPERVVLPAPPTEDDVRAALDEVAKTLVERNAPPVVRARVQRIDRTIRETLPRLRNLGLASYDGFSVMQTATDYLPEALDAYLRLPRQWADTRPIEGYKTALMILIEQLDLLAATMDKIFDAANREDANALITHGRFLEAKFGHGSSSTLTADGPVPEVPGTDQPPRPTNSLDL